MPVFVDLLLRGAYLFFKRRLPPQHLSPRKALIKAVARRAGEWLLVYEYDWRPANSICVAIIARVVARQGTPVASLLLRFNPVLPTSLTVAGVECVV